MSNSTKTILVIEDDDLIRQGVVFALKAARYKVLEAGNGLEGLDLLMSCQILPNLIVTDLDMPIMDGQKFLDGIQKNPLYTVIPVIVMSSDLNQLPKKYVVNVRLEKPFDITKLLDVVKANIGG